MQKDNDQTTPASPPLLNPKIKVLKWPSQSPDLNLIEMLLHDLKQAIHTRKPSNTTELNHSTIKKKVA